MNFSKRRRIFISSICLAGLLLSLPNFMPNFFEKLNISWLKPAPYGLDLKGGAYLLLEAKIDDAILMRLEDARYQTGKILRKNNVIFRSLKVKDNAVYFNILSEDDFAKTKRLLADVNSDMKLTGKDNRFKLAFTDTGLRKIKKAMINQAVVVVRQRIDSLGTKEPDIQAHGDDRILVQLPGFSEPEKVKEVLGKTAKLTFHFVNDKQNKSRARRSSKDTLLLPSWHDNYIKYPVEKRVIIGGDHLVKVRPDFHQGNPAVYFEFDSYGTKVFAKETSANLGKRLAFVLDGKVVGEPKTFSPILQGRVQTWGGFTSEDVKEISALLQSGSLPVDLEVVEERSIGPGLGLDSIKAGKMACFYALFALIVFMMLSYGVFGIIADMALVVNLLLLLGVLSFLQATLTLPGIAGIVLTMGMAVDANVLIFERIREEAKHETDLIEAIKSGFDFAKKTILDANITTLVAALVLFHFGTGPIKGFAVTLLIGLVTTIFTALEITRLLVLAWCEKSKTMPFQGD